jgi:hypothetical protein
VEDEKAPDVSEIVVMTDVEVEVVTEDAPTEESIAKAASDALAAKKEAEQRIAMENIEREMLWAYTSKHEALQEKKIAWRRSQR